MTFERVQRFVKAGLSMVLIAVLLTGGAAGSHFLLKQQETERTLTELNQTSAAALAQIKSQNDSRASVLETAYNQLNSERVLQETISNNLKLEEENTLSAQEAAEQAEEARKAEEGRLQKATADAQTPQTIASENTNAKTEATARSQISSMIKAQEANAIAENEAYMNNPPEAIVDLSVASLLQKPELPNGCEITAMAIVFNWMGYPMDKREMADKYLPRFPFYTIDQNGKTVRAGGDPNLFFAGNPANTSNAYYCFADPIVEAANKYMADLQVEGVAFNISGSDEGGLIGQLEMGRPVIAWGTLSMGDAYTSAANAWVINEETGEKHVPFLNLHCVVLYGYDETYFYVSDPIRGNVAVKRSSFMNAYRQIGSQAVVIQ